MYQQGSSWAVNYLRAMKSVNALTLGAPTCGSRTASRRATSMTGTMCTITRSGYRQTYPPPKESHIPRDTHVQHCAALICAYISNDDEGCGTLRGTSGLSYQQWHVSATILCATVLDLLAFHLDSRPLAVIEKYAPNATPRPGGNDRHRLLRPAPTSAHT